MNLAAAPDHARALGDGADKAAARLYNSIEHELELGDYTEEDADAGDQALGILEERFPGVRQTARQVTDPPALSRGAQSNVAGTGAGGATSHTGAGGHAPSGAHNAGGSGGTSRRPRSGAGTRRPSSSSRGRRGSSRGAVEQVVGFSGDDASGLVLTTLRWLLLAGLAYFILSPKGSGAFSGILGGLGKGISLVVDPVDPLAGKTVPSSALSGFGGGNFTQPPAPSSPIAPVRPPGHSAAAAPGSHLLGPGLARLATGPIGSHLRAPTSPLAIPIGGP